MGGFLAGGDPITLTVDSTATLKTAVDEWYGRPTCEIVNGVVVMVYKHGSAHGENDGELHIKFSDDYGATWSAEDKTIAGADVTNFPMNPPDCAAGQDAQEAWLMVAPNGDLLLHMWRSDYGIDFDGTYQSRSTDGGVTWNTPAAIDFDGLDAATDLLTFSTDDHFVYNGVIYAAARVFQDVTTTVCKNVLVKSTDNGATWVYVSDISTFDVPTWEAGIEYLGNNTIIAILRGLNDVKKSISNDMGATWSAPAVTPITAGGRHRILTAEHLRGEGTWWDDLHLVMSGFINGRQPVIWISANTGDTWTAYTLDDAIQDNGYGDMFYNPTTGKYVYLGYYGTQPAADIKQYNLTITGL